MLEKEVPTDSFPIWSSLLKLATKFLNCWGKKVSQFFMLILSHLMNCKQACNKNKTSPFCDLEIPL